MTDLLVEASVDEVLLEPRFDRWHASANCPVLLEQPEAFVQLASAPGGGRACTICVSDAGVSTSRSPSAPATA